MNSDKPLRLIQGAWSGDLNSRTWLELADGRKLPLPYHWRPDEFTLPGNVVELEEVKGFALYDETTRCGLMYCGISDTPYWQMIQPVTREHFFSEHAPQWVEAMLRMRLELGLG